MNTELKSQAIVLYEHLRHATVKGRATVSSPVKAREIVAHFNCDPHNWNITDSHVRAMVHELRMSGKDVGSDERGYFVIDKPEDYASTIRHLRGRLEKMAEVYRMVLKRRKIIQEMPTDLFDIKG